MIKTLAMSSLFGLVASSAPARERRNWMLVPAVDVYAPGNQEKHNRDATAGACSPLGAGRGLDTRALRD